ncbi:PAS domain S-box protein [Niveispirillum sp. SYP-B3756]|uniref:sensor histidine kinase n=1 Tax=Niveispirillum sp. SYP-B3756 TaxID=2662178 RepID=UPI0012928450|nr:PAS domain-containing sensor histidine kinase [Niveispirillum sp. SYP-B3756]MQP65117.1 PAS domain S-box protein [Niveispirillum sp. SYP-B3756]
MPKPGTPKGASISADERFRLVVEAAPNAMVLIDQGGLISMVNAATERLFGYQRAELLGQPVEMLVPESHRGHHAGLREGFFRNAQSSRPMGAGRDLFARHKDGSQIPVEIGLNPIQTDKGLMVLSAIVDISDRAQKLQRLNETLQARTQELEAVNHELEAFAYSVSHDLRAPLRSMDGFSLALLEDYSDRLDDTGKDYLTRIRRGAVRMAQLIDDLLKLSRVTRAGIAPQPTDLSALAQEVVTELRQLDPRRQVAVSIAPHLQAIADPHLIRVVLDNLLGNAWKFTNRRADAAIGFRAGSIDNRPGFQVFDNGVGFDMAYAHKLFAPFQRLHTASEFEGTGIGLATVARIIRRHGGEIRIDSMPNGGTTISFTLQARESTDV